MILLTLTGCGCSILSPYDSEFPCKGGYAGKCSSVRGAHVESLAGLDGGVKEQKNPPPCEGESCQAAKYQAGEQRVGLSPQESAEGAYKTSLYKRLDNLLQEPKMPVVAPPKVMRILMLPYKGQEGEFYMMRHTYFFVDEPRWVLGDSVEEIAE
jgi:conjugal transfer pilus assembly protein TraV